MKTRLLCDRDYDSLLELWQLSGLSSLKPNGRDSRSAFAAQLEAGQQVLGLFDDSAADGGRLVAAIVVTDDTRKGWLNRLSVHPDYRRQGLGTRLLLEGEALLRKKGIGIFAVLVEIDNDASRLMLEAAGYLPHPVHYLTKRDHHEI